MPGDTVSDPACVKPGELTRLGRWPRLKALLRTDAQRLLTTGVPHLFVALALTQGISIVRRILLARMLSVAELGQMTYVMQIADLLAVAVDLGLTTALLKYAAEPVGNERRRELYCAGLQWGSLAALVGSFIYLATVWILQVPTDQVIRLFMLMITPYIPLAAVTKIPIIFMQARKEIQRSARYTALTQALSLLVLVGVTYAFGLRGFFVAVIVAPASNLALLLYATRHELHWYRPSVQILKRLLGFGFFSVLANATGYANAAAAVVLLKHLTGSDEQVGLYGIGVNVMTGARLVPMALVQTAFPYLSGLLHEPARLRARMWELSLKQALAMLVLVSAWYLTGPYVITLAFGAKYAGAYWASVILILALLPFGMSSPASQTLLALGRVHVNFLFGLIQLVTNVVACYLLIPRFGILGAAAGVTAAQLVESSCATAYALALARRGPAAAPPGTLPPKA
jgi:O-antigen/teichoic acid export membrane protein